MLADYDCASKAGSRIAKIKWHQREESYNAYFNGGCYFKDADQYQNVRILANYTNAGFEGLAAIVECQVGKGKALLCGVHPECSAESLQSEMTKMSSEDVIHLENNIMSGLSDRSHRCLFTMLVERI